MNICFEGKTVVITGGASGMGEATAKAFCRAGAKVVCADLASPDASRAASFAGIEFYQVDVTSEEEVKAFAAYVDTQYKGADILFNNAGILIPGDGVECSFAVWEKTMAVNVNGVFLCSKYFLPQMMRKNAGAVINTSSISGLRADYGLIAYDASKGAVVNMTRSLALDFAKYNIRVNAVAPAQIRTPMFFRGDESFGIPGIMDAGVKDAYPMGRAGEPEEVANCVLFLASDYASFVTGHNFVIDGGATIQSGNQHQWERIIQGMKEGEDS